MADTKGADMGGDEIDQDFEMDEAQEQFLLELAEGQRSRLMLDRWLQRLMMEDVFCSTMIQCGLFLLNMGLFLTMVLLAYPAGDVSPIHSAIVSHFHLPLDVSNLKELLETTHHVAEGSRYFSPGSSHYVGDSLARAFVSTPVSVPPQITVPVHEEPKMLLNMTVTVWLRSRARYDTIFERVRRVQSNAIEGGGGHGGDDSGGKAHGSKNEEVCWRFKVEEISYGEHEGPKTAHVINPLAARIHRTGANADEEWQTSEIRRNFGTGAWHHWA